jgi:SRSO17 transposase
MVAAMNRTFTPELDAGTLRRLEAYAAHFAGDFNRPRQRAWCGVYLAGLLQDGERKSIEPLSRRVVLPATLQGTSDPDQGLQQFVSASAWDEQALGRRYRALMAKTFADPAGVFVLDDTTFPKAGSHSVGVQRQYCGALGKKANCQAAVSLHYVGAKGHVPLALRLFLPESWLEAPARLDKAGVPTDERRALTKGEIALELLDAVHAEGVLPGPVIVGDSGYGVSGPLRVGLAERGLHYVLGVTAEMIVFTEEPRWQAPGPRADGRPDGRRRGRARLCGDCAQPLSLREVAAQTPLRKVTWRKGTKGPMAGRFAWLRVWPAHGWATGDCAGEEPIWLLLEEQPDGTIKYAFSNLPANTSRLRAVRLWRERWKIEQGYQQMKEELGLDHFEGRSWRGFHHHAALVMLAFGFLALEQRRAKTRPPSKKSLPAAPA